MKRRLSWKSGLAAFLFSGSLWAASGPVDSTETYSSINDWMAKSEWRFHNRTYLMGTWNQGALRDDATWAEGGEMGLLTAPIRGWRFGFSGYFIFNLASTALGEDVGGLRNRYEIGQYDVTDRLAYRELERLEDLFVEKKWTYTSMRLGRQTLETPFFNKQDGRMRPTTEEGIWLQQSLKGWKAQAMAIWAVSPRSTIHWYDLKESIGPFGTGIDPLTGEKHALAIEEGSSALYIANVASPLWENIQLHSWSMIWPGVFQTHRVGMDHQPAQQGVVWAFHLYDQRALGTGGNVDPSKTYVLPDHHARVYSGQMGYKIRHREGFESITLNGTRITDDGRYLMPREWGRDPFFTFLPRERNEGLANVWAGSLKYAYQRGTQEWILAAGAYRLPEWSDYTRNKYRTPSYNQLYVEWADALTGFWKGVKLRTMLAYKWSTDPNLPDFVKVNTVNMLNASFIVDYHF